jgi:hypothetical protein
VGEDIVALQSRVIEAARVLLKQGGAEEEQIIPTLLAFANEIGQGLVDLVRLRCRLVEASGDAEEWERASDEFVGRYGSLRPARVADGVVILERLPVSIRIETDPDEGTPEEVNITVHAHRRLAKPEHVAHLPKWAMLGSNQRPPPCKGGQGFPTAPYPVGYLAYLSGFRHSRSGAKPTVFGSVLLRLQHGCSTLYCVLVAPARPRAS